MPKALISVSNKENIIDLANFLVSQDYEIISTGGTAKLLAENKIKITPITEVTGNPEAFGGRMKSISFQIGSALLYRRDQKNDIEDARKLNIPDIDLVICNLYPFKEVSKKTNNHDTLIENIDIGGPTMIRAAAKNYKSVTILTSPSQYQAFMEKFDSQTIKDRFEYAMEAFKMTAEYDQYILNTLSKDDIPVATTEASELRYGENPHQKAFVIPWKNTKTQDTLYSSEILQGKKMSYNNMIDADSAWKCTSELNVLYPEKKITTIVKHANPCGVSVSETINASIEDAWACDPVSSFGSIISVNYEIDDKFVSFLDQKFVEIILAPSFSEKAKELLAKKKNLRLIVTPLKSNHQGEYTIKSINGALLVQQEDEKNTYEYQKVTKASLDTSLSELKDFGMLVNKYLKSNSICLVAKNKSSFVIAGAGMGQPNRLDALKMLARPRAQELGFKLEDTLLISDAFFPFRDSIEVAHENKIKNILQPGGSIRDQEVIDACDEFGIAMEFTSTRHFRH